MRYAVVIEKAESNYSAYVPDLPGCIATGANIQQVEAEIRDAIVFHIDGLREDGSSIPYRQAKLNILILRHNSAARAYRMNGSRKRIHGIKRH